MTRILLVDDETEILESTSSLLAMEGYDVATESRSGQVLDTIRTKRPDIVHQDVRMPQLDLRSLIKAMRTDPAIAKIPVILFSATMSAPGMAAAVGADDAIDKPFLPDQLFALLEKWARRAAPS